MMKVKQGGVRRANGRNNVEAKFSDSIFAHVGRIAEVM